jgi:hypothetical protein
MNKEKLLTQRIWFLLLIVALFFLPAISQTRYDPRNTALVIATVLSKPIIGDYKEFYIIAKLLLLCVSVLPFIINRSEKFVLLYYSIILIITGLFQNMANTAEYGFVWLIGNTIVILLVSIFCGIDVLKKKSIIEKYELCKKRLWVLPFMALALLFPYGIGPNNAIIPQFGVNMFTNEAGLTYCMITPIILGIFLLFPNKIDMQTHFITAFVGFIFGIFNIMNWFILQPVFWWMGILHMPLILLSLYSFIVLRKKERPALASA